jgi:hypothetical protein
LWRARWSHRGVTIGAWPSRSRTAPPRATARAGATSYGFPRA